jgi:hypothetical protein
MIMRTMSGREFDPFDLQPDDVDLHDIAHALARTCRYGGHVPGYYSVAQHSCYVAKQIAEYGCNGQVQMMGLLHDASEAYLGDVIRPLKVHLDEYKGIEARVQGVIFEKYLPGVEIDWQVVNAADNIVLDIEAVVFRTWADGWPPDYASANFLNMAHGLQ